MSASVTGVARSAQVSATLAFSVSSETLGHPRAEVAVVA